MDALVLNVSSVVNLNPWLEAIPLEDGLRVEGCGCQRDVQLGRLSRPSHLNTQPMEHAPNRDAHT